MSNLIHCDGPDCTETVVPGMQVPWCHVPWLHLEQEGILDLHFHSRECLARWAGPTPTPAPAVVAEHVEATA